MVAKTEFEKAALRNAKSNFKSLKKHTEKYNASLNQLLTAFSVAKLPDWGSFTFNGQRV